MLIKSEVVKVSGMSLQDEKHVLKKDSIEAHMVVTVGSHLHSKLTVLDS